MKWIENPPKFAEILKKGAENIINSLTEPEISTYINHLNEKYISWNELKYRPLPNKLDRETVWALIKISRMSQSRKTNLESIDGNQFWYWLPDAVLKELHFIDQNASGQLLIDEPTVRDAGKDKYIISSLMEEAIASSILEGAATTRKKAKEMLREGRKPKTHGEIMIQNNYSTMLKIKEHAAKKLTIELLCEIQASITFNTLEDSTASGRLRRADEEIHVVDTTDGIILHTPPPADELKVRLQKLCDFANELVDETFIHPVVKGAMLHFWLAYEHPFVDGNGRTSRALFYWYLLKRKYWLVEFLPISRIILRAPSQYKMAFINTERDDNDLTYFIHFHLRTFHLSIEDFKKYILKKQEELKEARKFLKRLTLLNHRQQELINHAIHHSDAYYTIQRHMSIHGIVYQTARTDLLQLVKRDLLKMEKQGKVYVFIPCENLMRKLKSR